MYDLKSDLTHHIEGEFFHKLEYNDPHQVLEKEYHLSFLLYMLDEPNKFEAYYDLSQLIFFLPFKLSNSGLSS